jgi:hypothetical protein
MKENLMAMVTGIIFLIIGIICLLWPDRIQQYSLDYYINHKTAEKLNPFLNWMKTQSYIWALRIIGVIGIGAFILILFVFIKDLRTR